MSFDSLPSRVSLLLKKFDIQDVAILVLYFRCRRRKLKIGEPLNVAFLLLGIQTATSNMIIFLQIQFRFRENLITIRIKVKENKQKKTFS